MKIILLPTRRLFGADSFQRQGSHRERVQRLAMLSGVTTQGFPSLDDPGQNSWYSVRELSRKLSKLSMIWSKLPVIIAIRRALTRALGCSDYSRTALVSLAKSVFIVGNLLGEDSELRLPIAPMSYLLALAAIFGGASCIFKNLKCFYIILPLFRFYATTSV